MKKLASILLAFSSLSCSNTNDREQVSSAREVVTTSPIENSEIQKTLKEQAQRKENGIERRDRLNEQGKRQDNQARKVILQYRTRLDAVAPGFREVMENGLSDSVPIKWDVPDAQLKKKLAFDKLIRELEGQEINGVELKCPAGQRPWEIAWQIGLQINGVEFECSAEDLPSGELRVTTVPQLTEKGRERLKEGREDIRRGREWIKEHEFFNHVR